MTFGLATNASGSEERLWRLTCAPLVLRPAQVLADVDELLVDGRAADAGLAAHRRLEHLDATSGGGVSGVTLMTLRVVMAWEDSGFACDVEAGSGVPGLRARTIAEVACS